MIGTIADTASYCLAAMCVGVMITALYNLIKGL